MSSLVISAPGKVLVAGGYLVLDPAYSGVVVSTSSRFYTAITPGNTNCILVRSPQFVNATWSYTWSISKTASPPSVVVSQVERYLAYRQLEGFSSFSPPRIIKSAPMHRRINSYISPCKRPYRSPWKRKVLQSSDKLWVPALTSQSSEIMTFIRNRIRHVSPLRSHRPCATKPAHL
jgi:hypothetical protein